ncbi:phage major capsid protein [Clostridium gasigenes]|uniref:phage major capsid protein n=1 Tax=Clostridium gasigenes TaxID=94869 RepID=UPI001629A6B7|nr:phage major capsid protein [Clostridium gasigenes]MBB6622166.1 phage major capsid protein [Clostridium gasigenes]
MQKERRSQQSNISATKNKIVGIIKYNSKSQLIDGQFYEVLSPKAFQYEVVKALWNHDTNIVLGSTRNNTLKLNNGAEGLSFEIEVPKLRADILESVERGDVEASSFGMNVLEDSWDYSQEYPIRTILKAELFEISPTPFPAYDGNLISTRALEQIKNNNEGGNNMNEQLKKILGMIADGKTNEEIKVEIEKMLGTEVKAEVGADPQVNETLRSILKNIKKEEGNNMDKEELRTLMAEIHSEEKTKGELRSAIFNQSPVEVKSTDKEYRSAFRKMIQGKPMSDLEVRTIGNKTGDGAMVIGDEFYNKITELKRSMNDLSKYFNVMPVGATTGTLPIEVSADMVPMAVVGEDEKNKDGQDPKFKQVKYAIKDMREVYKLANSFVKDEQVDIMGYLAKKIALKDVFSTNYYLLNGFTGKDGLLTNPIFKTEKLTVAITLDKIMKVINSFDPALRSDLKIICNNDGYSLLSSLKYEDGRLVMQENATLASGYQLLSKEIVELSPTLLKTDATEGTPFIIAHKDAVTIFERQAYEVKSSDIAGFDDDETKVRVTVRKDIQAIDKEACKIVYSKLV